MEQLDPKKFFENIFEAVQDDQKKKRRKTILWSILIGIIIYLISLPCFLHPFWNFTHFFGGPGVCTRFTLEGLGESDDFDKFLKNRMMAFLGGNGNLPLNTLLQAAGVTLNNGTIQNTQSLSSPTSSYTTYNTATQQLLAGSGISVITNNGGTIINAVLGDNVDLSSEVTGSLPAGQISNTDDVTAASNKVILGGSPLGAVLKPFSIDVNEAALNLANLGGVINLANQVTGVLPVTNGGTGLSTAGADGTIFTVVAGVPTWVPASAVVVPNDVTAGSTKVTLGGTPTGAALQPFSIDVNEANLSLQNIGGSLLLTQITPGTNGQVLTTVGGVSTWTTPAATTVSNTSTGNDLTTTVNGVTGTAVPIINTNILSLDASNQLISTVNGIASAALPIFSASTVDNGLSIGADNRIELGGKLHQATNIDQAGYDLAITDGLVGIGTAAPAYTLDVLGDFNQTTTLANGNQSSIHSGSNVMGMGLMGEGMTNMNTATGDLGFTFVGDASAIGGVANEATIGITNFTTGNNTQYFAQVDGSGTYTSMIQTQNGPNYASLRVESGELQLSVWDGTASGYVHLTPGMLDIWDVDMRIGQYPSFRDDTTTFAPVNFLYTGTDGHVYSAPTSSLASTLLKYYSESTVSPNSAPVSTGNYAVAIGDGAQALGDKAYVFGRGSVVSGMDAYSIGYDNAVTKDYAYAIGNNNITDGNYSLLIGADNRTTADSNYMFGYTNRIDGGTENFSIGNNNVTSGVSHTLLFGQGLVPTSDSIVEAGPTDASKITIDSTGRLTLRGAFNVTGSDGNLGDVLVSQGTGVMPVWKSPASGLLKYYTESSLAPQISSPIASGNYSVAIGDGAVASGAVSHAFGFMANAGADGAFAIGSQATAGGQGSYAIGDLSNSAGWQSYSFGFQNANNGTESYIFGRNTTINGGDSYAMGDGNRIDGNNSSAVGESNAITGNNSYAFGLLNNLSALQQMAVGTGNTLTVDAAYVMGHDNRIDGSNSGVFGDRNTVSNDAYESIVIGQDNQLSGSRSFIFGNSNLSIPGGTKDNYIIGETNDFSGATGSHIVNYASYTTGTDDINDVYVAGFNNNLSSGVYSSGIFGTGNALSSVSNAFALGSGLTNVTSNTLDIGIGDASKATLDNEGRLTIRGPLNVTASDGNTGDILVSQGAGVMPVWSSPSTALASMNCTNSTTIFCQNGNSFGSTGVLGINDANDLIIKAQNTEAIRLFANGKVAVGNITPATATAPNGVLTVRASTAGPAILVKGYNSGTYPQIELDALDQYQSNHGLNWTVNGNPYFNITKLSGTLGALNFNSSNTAPFAFTGANVGIGTTTPGNKLEITQGTAGNSGLRFTNLNSGSTTVANNSLQLSLNASGDVILTPDAVTANRAWSTTGNTALSAATNFMGTTDAVDVPFRTNNVEKMRLFSLVNPSLGMGRSTLTGVNGGASSYSGPTIFTGAAGNFSGSTGWDFIMDDDHNATNNQIRFRANGDGASGTIDIMTVDEVGGGRVGIGTTAPSYKLDIFDNSTAFAQTRVQGGASGGGVLTRLLNDTSQEYVVGVGGSANGTLGSSAFFVRDMTAGANRIVVAPTTGNVGIGNFAASMPTAQLHTTGTVRFQAFGAGTLITDANGNLSVSSDERLKNIEGGFNRGLSALQNISPIAYHWKTSTGYDTENTYYGFSAQNIQANIPEAVGEDSRGFLTISDRPILATVINATKELATNADATNATITTLNTGLEAQSGSLTTLEQTLADNTAAIESLTENVTSLEDRVAALENAGAVTTASAPTDGIFTIAINFMEDVVFEKVVTFKDMILVEGPAVFSDLVQFNDVVVFNKDAAGHATINSGDSSVEVTFEEPYPSAPVVTVTPNEKVDALYYVTNVTENGFTIEMDPSATENVKFSWNAVAVDNAAPAL